MKICAISDTHKQRIKIPKCDIFIWAGDDDIKDLNTLNNFKEYIDLIDAPYKILIGGNHDFYLEKIGKEKCKKLFNNAIYLENEEIIVDGIKIWGSPYSNKFGSWAFMQFEEELEKFYKTIAEDTRIIITHGPSYGILDQVSFNNRSVGSLKLQEKIKEIHPQIHICGHIHESYGKYTDYNTDYYNVSILDDYYNLINKPTIIEI